MKNKRFLFILLAFSLASCGNGIDENDSYVPSHSSSSMKSTSTLQEQESSTESSYEESSSNKVDSESTDAASSIPEGHWLVQFDSKGGSGVESQVVMDGQCAQKPANPEKETENALFAFLRWELDRNEFDFATPIRADITLIAKYKVVEYYI